MNTNTLRTMVERHHGWEGASPGLLGKVFGVSTQRATAIVQERCAVCDKPICGHRDDEWAGNHSNTRPSISTADHDGGCEAQAALSSVNAATAAGCDMTVAKPGNVASSQVPA
ncbi:hypothetical protein [Sphingomonas turrisvirgatae]|uniref:Uncharacterized protein n=1 Tax=Sphingomonas turrisvirgatae TaxID=1888892 RepID=A0A1E3LZY3_9SPHN|nr:hypothetical protein [Sphingomonas turrisvirgatae]ODP39278.1 hypothetical protein BFL28_10720 [Sphingomonas turrisvirgatae]